MTIEEKRIELEEYCGSLDRCDKCPLFDGNCNYYKADNEDIEKAYEKYKKYKNTASDGIQSAKEEAVEHPNHYNRENGMECIDEMLLIYGLKNTIMFCLMNAHKYRYRAISKNGMQDIEKSDYYMKTAEELMNKNDICIDFDLRFIDIGLK